MNSIKENLVSLYPGDKWFPQVLIWKPITKTIQTPTSWKITGNQSLIKKPPSHWTLSSRGHICQDVAIDPPTLGQCLYWIMINYRRN